MPAHRDLGLGTEDGVFEFHVDIFAQVSAALRAAAAACASAKNLSQSEEVAENIAQVSGVEACTSVSARRFSAWRFGDRSLPFNFRSKWQRNQCPSG